MKNTEGRQFTIRLQNLLLQVFTQIRYCVLLLYFFCDIKSSGQDTYEKNWVTSVHCPCCCWRGLEVVEKPITAWMEEDLGNLWVLAKVKAKGGK